MKEIKFGIKIRFMISIEIDYQSSKKKMRDKTELFKWNSKLLFILSLFFILIFFLNFTFSSKKKKNKKTR